MQLAVRNYGVNGLGLGLGLGADGSSDGSGTRAATSAVRTAATVGTMAAKPIAASLGVAVPIVGAAIAGIALAVTAWLNRMGPRQKVWTTEIANDATAQLQEVQRVYFSEPYTPGNQAAALQATQQLLDAIQQGCGQPQMGEPGRRCISERLVRGGSAPWCPTGTGCDYLTVYLDPIANDPRAAEYVSPVEEVTGQITGAMGGAVQSAVQAANTPVGGLLLLGLAGLILYKAVD